MTDRVNQNSSSLVALFDRIRLERMVDIWVVSECFLNLLISILVVRVRFAVEVCLIDE